MLGCFVALRVLPRNAPSLKALMALLRYSAHDPEVLFGLRKEFASQCVAPFLGPRKETDLQKDLEVSSCLCIWIFSATTRASFEIEACLLWLRRIRHPFNQVQPFARLVRLYLSITFHFSVFLNTGTSSMITRMSRMSWLSSQCELGGLIGHCSSSKYKLNSPRRLYRVAAISHQHRD